MQRKNLVQCACCYACAYISCGQDYLVCHECSASVVSWIEGHHVRVQDVHRTGKYHKKHTR